MKAAGWEKLEAGDGKREIAPGGDRRYLVWLLPLICAVWVGRALYLRQGPESFPPPEMPNFAIHDSRLYWVSGRTFLTRPVAGGPVREVTREDSNVQLTGFLTFLNASILYSTYSQNRYDSSTRFGLPGKVRFLGAYRAVRSRPSPQQTAREQRTVWQDRLPAASPVRRRIVPLQGGVPRDYAPSPDGAGILLGERVYRIRQRPDEGVTVTAGDTSWFEIAGHSDLIATSVADGSSRTLRTGLARSTPLLAGQNGVFWLEPRPYPDSRQNLLYYRAVEGKTYVLPDYKGRPDQPPVEYRGRLFCLFQEAATGDKPETTIPRYLCCLRPERPNPMEDVLALPGLSGHYLLDQGYLYFTHREDHRPFLDLLTGDDTHLESRQRLCRIRLPD